MTVKMSDPTPGPCGTVETQFVFDDGYIPPGEPWHNGHDAQEYEQSTPPVVTFRRIINPANWEGLPIPPREWIVPDYIPHKTVTLLGGDGATGKS
jgi:AAA domain